MFLITGCVTDQNAGGVVQADDDGFTDSSTLVWIKKSGTEGRSRLFGQLVSL